jgi:DNA-binding transcriptional regulator LsrR (DeoR family)
MTIKAEDETPHFRHSNGSVGRRSDSKKSAGKRSDPTINDPDLKTRIAWMYYVEGMTQEAIAERLEINRLRILKILAQCREDGTVQIRINSKATDCVRLARELEETFGLSRAIVVPRPFDEEKLSEVIGVATGTYLSEVLTDGMSIGLGWGETLQRSLKAVSLRPLRSCSVVSLLGALTKASAHNPSEFAWRFAELLGADCYFLAGPVYAPDEATRDGLFRHAGIEEVIERAHRLDIAVVSVGDLSSQTTIARYNLLPEADLATLADAGAVGDVLCHFINERGEVVDHSVNRRVVAVHPGTIRGTPKLVLASGGWRKVKVTMAAIRLLRPSVLITDESAAEEIIARYAMQSI